MNAKFAVLIATLITLGNPAAFAQNATLPKAKKADVETLVASIKGDKAKLAQYCELIKLEDQANAIAKQNPNDPKLQAMDKQWEDMAAKIGPDFQKITNSELDDASQMLMYDLSKTCK